MTSTKAGGPPARRAITSLTDRPVGRTLTRMAFPMLAGTLSMQAFNLTDTWFVAKLGTLPLAAMGFTFPVVMVVACLVRGLGTGGTALISHALGQGDHDQARRVTTHTMILGIAVVLCISAIGLLTIDPIFRALGATDDVLPMIHDYMTIWYLGVVFMVLPMVANDAIRATGDTVRPGMLMMTGSLLNIALDPIMIFGWMSFPAMGIRGAALATIISRGLTCIASFWVLHRRHQLLLLSMPSPKALWQSWRNVLTIGAPSAFSNLLAPMAAAVITWIIADYGPAAVAATGAGGRIEIFAFMIPMCLGVSLVPFVGQNFGAGRLDRVREARKLSMGFAAIFGLLTYAMFFFGAPLFARFFSNDPEVIAILSHYLRIVGFGHGMMEVHRYAGFFLNAIHKPIHAMGVNMLRILVLLIPFAVVGEMLFGLDGVFWGRMFADVIAGVMGVAWSGTILHSLAKSHEVTPPPEEDCLQPVQ